MNIQQLEEKRQYWKDRIAEAEKINPLVPLGYYIRLSVASSELRNARRKS